MNLPSISEVSKAIGGALAAAIVGFASSRFHLNVSPATADAIKVLVSAAIGFVVVYVSPKNRAAK